MYFITLCLMTSYTTKEKTNIYKISNEMSFMFRNGCSHNVSLTGGVTVCTEAVSPHVPDGLDGHCITLAS